jgi:phosphoribosylanthranilate isomerase
MTKIKVCGIKSEKKALEVAEAGADYVGLVFAQSPRQVSPAVGARIAAALKNAKAPVETVGVFVNTPAKTVKKIADACDLDWIQLSGDEPWEYCRELERPVIKVIHVSRDYGPECVCADLKYGKKVLGNRKHLLLLDSSSVSRRYGGTGVTFDWDIARPVAGRFPVIIAGGLTPENVAAAIEILSPWGVDVSSGVETRGIKDMKKVLKFIRAVRSTDAG